MVLLKTDFPAGRYPALAPCPRKSPGPGFPGCGEPVQVGDHRQRQACPQSLPPYTLPGDFPGSGHRPVWTGGGHRGPAGAGNGQTLGRAGPANGKENQAATEELIAALEACGCEKAKSILAHKEYLAKKSVWVFGGDGWAYDIGFGGLDHVLASGEDINVMVFDTEVYSNTGGQASKASQVGQVAQFAAAGKAINKKSLSEIAMSYGYVYVAQIAMGADMNQTIKAIAEAEAYPGPSLIIGYAPCEMHSIKGGMGNCQKEMKRAVECGYWNMFRFNPALKAEGKNPFTLDSKAPTADYKEFIMGEARYSSLTRAFPERAEELFEKAAQNSRARYDHLVRLGELYAAK